LPTARPLARAPDIDGIVIRTAIEDAFCSISRSPTSRRAGRPMPDRRRPSWDGKEISPMLHSRLIAAPARSVLVADGRRDHPGARGAQIHTESSGSFAASEFGPIGVIDGGAVMFRRLTPRPLARRGRAGRAARPADRHA
jgi:hypothetical protein